MLSRFTGWPLGSHKTILLISTAFSTFSLAVVTASAENIVFHGDCDASTAIATGGDTFFVIGDEKKPHARLYKSSGELLDEVALKPFLAAGTEDKEPDLEASAKLKDTVFVLGSHGRDNEGNRCPERNQLFAFKYKYKNSKLELTQVDSSVTSLHEQIVKAFSQFKLDSDPNHDNKRLAPKEGTSINIEGLAADSVNDNLLIGLRSPLAPGKKAVVLPLNNPFKLVKGQTTEAKFGEAIVLDLNGEGIRSMEYWPENHCYLIVSGNCGEERGFSVYKWNGTAADNKPKEIISARSETQFNPEAIVLFPNESKRFLLLSDDGKQKVGGLDCKKVDKSKRRFAGRWFEFK